jgi:hypothetical protein
MQIAESGNFLSNNVTMINQERGRFGVAIHYETSFQLLFWLTLPIPYNMYMNFTSYLHIKE